MGYRLAVMPRPFLKWAGGKGQLLDKLMGVVDSASPFQRYHEPFVGGGALFFELARQGLLHETPYLSDTNPNLIETYVGVRDRVEEVIERLHEHARCHSKDYYYSVRANVPDDLVARAARIIYLNKTCYNGLYRENSKGEFNVPFGRYRNPAICDEENLRAASEALQGADISTRSFETVLELARPGDLVYFDPPYHPVSKTSSFTSYAKDGFSEADQRRLASVFDQLAQSGIRVFLSNSMTRLVRDLYSHFEIVEVRANRALNSNAHRRGKISEALVVSV